MLKAWDTDDVTDASKTGMVVLLGIGMLKSQGHWLLGIRDAGKP